MKISILLADDHSLIRHFFKLSLESDERFQVVAETESGEGAVMLCRFHQPDIVLMDISMVGMDGIRATKHIVKSSPGSKVLCVSSHCDPYTIKKMMQHGAWGYLTKTSSKDEMIRGIIEVHAGRQFICGEANQSLQNKDDNKNMPSIQVLSERELEVCTLVQAGNTSKEIATKLSISVHTVETHRQNILKKLELKNTATLINFLSQQGGAKMAV
jgi:DNA-binding NarL/FixJ family response regulator